MSELGNFPFVFKPNVTAIDRAMREFAASAAWLFEDIIGQGLITLVNTINRLLGFIPWFVMVLFVFALGYAPAAVCAAASCMPPCCAR